MKKHPARWVAAVAAATLVVAACGGDDDDGAASTEAPAGSEAPAATDAPAGTEAPVATEAPEATEAPAGSEAPSGGGSADLDTNGDGEIHFGIAAAGPADDGAYYQAVVDAAKEISEENGFGEPIVVDNIQAADAATAIGDLAQQGVDVIIVGASRDRRAAAPAHRRVPGHLLVLQLRRRLPRGPGPRPEHRRRRRDQLHRRLRHGPAAAGDRRRHRGRSSAAATSASRSRRTWPSSSACRPSTRRTR